MSKHTVINADKTAAVVVEKTRNEYSVLVQSVSPLDDSTSRAVGFFSREELVALQASITEALAA